MEPPKKRRKRQDAGHLREALTKRCQLSEDDFDSRYDYVYDDSSVHKFGGMRGGSCYMPPVGWTKLALNVQNKYEPFGKWLDKENGWPVAYHGTAAEPTTIKDIIRGGLKIRGGKERALHGERYGSGVYCSPDVDFAMRYSDKLLENEMFIVFVCRVRPGKYRIEKPAGGSEQWIVQDEADIRVCAVLLKSNGLDCGCGNYWLWHANLARETKKYQYPNGSQMVGDGEGGVWILCRTQNGHSLHSQWHANEQRELELYKYPSGSKMVGDGQGGTWILCATNHYGNSEFWLWHAKRYREERKYQYPETSQIVGDGNGGVWVLCPTSGMQLTTSGMLCPTSGHRLWHATDRREVPKYDYPMNSQMVGDGQGGVWLLCSKDIEGKSESCLWHANEQAEKMMYKYPANSRIAGDGKGGAWILCSTNTAGKSETWLWHATLYDEKQCYKYPENSRLVGDGLGGAWVLCPSTVDNKTEFWLWHVDRQQEIRKYKYPESSQMVEDGRGGIWVLCQSE
mmetsp:Transcript_106723/g.188998  ORF Transcript_106723/g.188998 Transcript_106723/m.188998 type:complete len:510 (+) Transcript_106723:42-1571(+)